MPYIKKERVAQIREELKKQFPDMKMSVTRRHHSEVSIVILSAPWDMLATSDQGDKKRGYEQVNQFYIAEHYKDDPQTRDALLIIYSIANEGNGTLVVDSDYGAVPDFYVSISIGAFEKPFTVTESKKVAENKQNPPVKTEGISIVDYSEKAIAVVGDTYPIKDKLRKMGGKFNRFLSCGAGWIFPKTKQSEIQSALSL